MKTFSALLALCVGNSPVTGEFPSQRPVTQSFDVFFDLRLNKRLSKQSWGWWFETPSCSLWRHCNDWCGAVIWYRRQTTTQNQVYCLHSRKLTVAKTQVRSSVSVVKHPHTLARNTAIPHLTDINGPSRLMSGSPWAAITLTTRYIL